MERGILFVDDEEPILTALGRELRPWLQDRGLSFWKATSAEAALQFLRTEHGRVQVLVSDLKMPGMAGDELVARVKQFWPDIEAVLLSGHAEIQGLSRAVGAGIRGFVPKPWDTAGLTHELGKALDSRNRLREEDLQYNHLTSQLARTGDMQRTLFRRDELDPKRFRLELTYRPLEGHFCGGDFYEVVSLGPDRCVVLVGDVSGHGAAAAFVTGVLHTLITQDEIFNLLAGSASPAYLLNRLNDLFFSILAADQARNVSLSALVFDRSAGTLQLANAGGLPLILVRAGEGRTIHLPGFPLGLDPEAVYTVQTLDLVPGDRWVLMTDGLVDRGPEGLIPGPEVSQTVARAFVDGGGHPAILEALGLRFPDGDFLDDLTLLSVEVV